MFMMKHDGRRVKMMDDESLEFTKDKIFMMIMIMTFFILSPEFNISLRALLVR